MKLHLLVLMQKLAFNLFSATAVRVGPTFLRKSLNYECNMETHN